MAIQSGKFSATRRSIWHRARFQLGVAFVVAVLLPWAARVNYAIEEFDWRGLQNSFAGTSAALLVGFYGFKRLSHYPGVRLFNNVLPAFAASYGLILAIFFFLRLDYSRLHFFASFVLCVFWFYIVYFKLQRQPLRIGVVPGGSTARLGDIQGIGWMPLSDAAAPNDVDVIAADLRADLGERWERFLADCALRGLLVMHVKQIEESLTGRVDIEHLSENTLGSLVPGIVYGKLKRAFDFLLALTVLPILAPIFLVIAIAIRSGSQGPAFFRQQRMGYRGAPFTMFKFRTMTVDASHGDDARIAAMTNDDDLRVTAVGRFLRRYRLDELPQLFNVLRGEMSWIGPRPEALPLSFWYESELPFYRYRHIVRPGITGWAQVRQGHVFSVDEVLGKLHYDFYYIKNFSFWLDLLIVASTIRIVATGFGAR